VIVGDSDRSGEPVAPLKEALGIELALRNVPFMTEVPFPIIYKGHKLAGYYKADFVCFDSIVVEVKASARNPELEQAQMLNYLRASDLELGLLLDFGGPKMTFRRFIKNDNWSRE
jgi:GxxExxY protein